MEEDEDSAPPPRTMAYAAAPINGQNGSSYTNGGFDDTPSVEWNSAAHISDEPPDWAINSDPNWMPYDDEEDAQPQPKLLRVRFYRGENEKRRWRKVHSEIHAFPGIDHVQVLIMDGEEETHVVEFDETTNYCDALIEKLKRISGVEVV
jgi:hypothetical protein